MRNTLNKSQIPSPTTGLPVLPLGRRRRKERRISLSPVYLSLPRTCCGAWNAGGLPREGEEARHAAEDAGQAWSKPLSREEPDLDPGPLGRDRGMTLKVSGDCALPAILRPTLHADATTG